MSRNMRHKSQVTPTRKTNKTVRRNSTLADTTSDDDYAGVDAISDSEDGDEPDVEEAEEQAIIESEDDDVQTPRPSIDEDQSSWDGFETQEEILGENTQFFEDHIARGHAPDHDTEATVFNHGLSEEDVNVARRVHFEIPGYEAADESSDTDDEEELWPDLFVPQSSLDASFRKALESNEDEVFGGSSDGEGSYWDFHGDEPSHGIQADRPKDDDEEESSSDNSAGSSGYETDDGETTEEDLPDAAQYVGPGRSVLRRPSTDSGSEEEITIARRTSFRNQNGPFLGTWIRDRTKPFVLMDNKAKKLIMFKAEINPRRWSMDASNSLQNLGNFNIQQDNYNEDPVEQLSPMISNSGNLMMSAMNGTFNGNGNQAFGPPEAFFPFTNIDPNGNILQDSLESYDEEDDIDDEDLWVIEDLLDFGSTASVAGDNEEDDSAQPSSTPARPTTAASEDQMNSLLAHPHLVGAFRNNQDRHQLLSRNKASRASLAFSGPHNQGPIRGIKDNRLAAANTPITPVRRQKPAKVTYPSSPASPLVQQSNKRKASNGLDMSHKRTRSLI
ncbi:hypothetical protein D0Z07_4062 [Hyphodiscus hymeniophilus]|uniref:Uncharacterized protein n=1 Tax=Hyphodiscus hymeniophilus TaxID=353542 RepID=A0A9P7AXH9_9HELO|nr:hypothetical protein D0Z07_4062 [Hyphodiscus hymeniophilus]